MRAKTNTTFKLIVVCSRVAQWKRAGPITQRSVDRNYALLTIVFRAVQSLQWRELGGHLSGSLLWEPILSRLIDKRMFMFSRISTTISEIIYRIDTGCEVVLCPAQSLQWL